MTLRSEAETLHFKDAVLDRLAAEANVDQFVSFGPDLEPRYSRVHGQVENRQFEDVSAAIRTLLDRSGEHSVNVRSFDPRQPKSNEFVYGLTTAEATEGAVRRLAAAGLFTIANETIDVRDGGV